MKIIVPNTSSSFFTKLNFNHGCKGEDVVDNKTNESMKESPSSAPVSPNTSFITTPTITNTTSMATTDMNLEENRLKTFDASWPHSYIRPRILAKIGFYYLRPNNSQEPDDRVKCNFCKVEVQQWEPSDNEIGEHLKHSSNCPLLRRNETPNVPIDAAELDQLLPPVSYDVCGTYAAIDRRPDAYPETPFPPSPSVDIVENTSDMPHTTNSTVERETQTLKHPDYPEYAIETARLRSFDEWPKTMKQTPQQLSDAGFFYTRVGDRVICFSCGGGLRGWEEDDQPWEQHALWYGKCDYLRLLKGPEYVETVKAKFMAQSEENNGSLSASSQESVASSCNSGCSSSSSAASSTSSTPINSQSCGERDEQTPDKKICESRLCKICYSSEYNTAFFPCGHVIACAKCASSVTKCPMCRKPYERLMRVYFS